MRIARVDVRQAVLATLAEQPMSGYQIVRTLEERGRGLPTPSAGAVYPMLQLLADEGLATAAESAGSRTYSLTDAGRAAARTAATSTSSPPERSRMRIAQRVGAIPRAGAQLAQAAAAVAQNGSAQQIAEAVVVLDEARRKLYSILART